MENFGVIVKTQFTKKSWLTELYLFIFSKYCHKRKLTTWIPHTHTQENYRSVSAMNTGAKIISKTLAN